MLNILVLFLFFEMTEEEGKEVQNVLRISVRAESITGIQM